MPYIAERNVFLRARVEVPAGLKLMTKKFQEGWTFVSGDASQVEKKIRTGGWSFVKIADPSLRSGVGESSQEAIASALRLTLRRISEHFNAVEVARIELTQYPWFFLARIRIYFYRIQQSVVPPVPDEAAHISIAPPQRRLPLHSAAMHPTR
jgi:hypothetical protein